MGESNMDEMSLPSLFEQACKTHQLASQSAVDQDGIRNGCQALEKCEEMISKLGLFSSNETKDDISTTNLKYLLVPYYLGELTEKNSEGDRIQVLKASIVKLMEFISFCESMELVPKEEIESSLEGGTNVLADQRARKIARFKRQRAAESKLAEIKECKERRGRSTRAAALSTPIDAAAREEDISDDDGEEEREAWLTTISLALCKAFNLLEMLKKEEEMLSAMQELQLQDKNLSETILDERAKKAESWHRNAATRAKYTKAAEPITCATFAQDVLEGRAQVSQAHQHKHQPLIFGPASLVGRTTLTTERERMAAQVFQPSHRLPTMSIEEAGLKEMELMNNWQERNVKLMEEANSSWYREPRKPGPQGDDEDEEDDDDAVDKARRMDDWKDDNPRGAGNKKLTPCG